MTSKDNLNHRLYSNPAWTLRRGTEQQLLCSAGADQLFAIEELEAYVILEILNCWGKGLFNSAKLSKRANEIVEQLLSAGIVRPKLGKTDKNIQIAIVGDPKYTAKIKPSLQQANSATSEEKMADLKIVLRTSQSYAQLLDELDYSNLKTPHLLVDMGFHHTVSIGPLVLPGQTACLACLQGRLTNRWGDNPPPSEPAMLNYIGFARELLNVELAKLINDKDYSLVQKTVVYDLNERQVQVNPLYKVPLCPICANNSLDISGMIALPWA